MKIKLFILTLVSALLCCTCAFAADTPISDAPYLTDISFDNAEIDGGFNTTDVEFFITLEDNAKTPTIRSFSVNGNAQMLISYNFDSSNHPYGLTVTLQFDKGSIIYTFNYSNPPGYSPNGNTNLTALTCENTEVDPEITAGQTSYKLYIPSDMTELNLTPVTEDINAYCSPQTIILAEGQETTLKFTVTASNGDTKVYSFDVKRVSKTTEEVMAEMRSPDYTSIAVGERFYEKPEFYIAIGATVAGVVIIIVLVAVTRRFTLNPYDSEEPAFYLEIPEENEDDEGSDNE